MPSANAINISANGLVSFNGTKFQNNSITQYAVLVGNSSNGITNIGPGTAGQLLLSGGASADPSYVTPTAGAGTKVTTNASTYKYELGGGLVYIDSKTASAQASLTFTSGIGSPYQTFVVVYNNVTGPATTILLLQLSTDGGSTYISTGYQSGVFRWGSSSNANTNSTAGLTISSTDTVNVQNGIIYLTNIRNGGFAVGIGRSNRVSSTVGNSWNYMGTYPTNVTANAFKIVSASGGNFSGTFTIYGMKEG